MPGVDEYNPWAVGLRCRLPSQTNSTCFLFTTAPSAVECPISSAGATAQAVNSGAACSAVLPLSGDVLDGGSRGVRFDRFDSLLHGRRGRIHLASPQRFPVRGFEDEVGLVAVRRLALVAPF